MQIMQARLLVTGGDGAVGRQIRSHLLHAGYALRLYGNMPAESLSRGEEEVVADIRDMDTLIAAMEGCDGVIHLAAASSDVSWPQQLQHNVEGGVALFEAAKNAGLPRVIYASSHHVVGMYPRVRQVSPLDPMRPDSRYAAAKAFGELLGSLYADKHGLRVLAIRIGWVGPRPVERRSLAHWISPADLTRLIIAGLKDPDLHFRVVFGVSSNLRSFYQSESHESRYAVTLDQAEDYADEVLASDPPSSGSSDSPGELFQGGVFVDREFTGDLQRTLKAGAIKTSSK
jgi:uronate dehydrogenase